MKILAATTLLATLPLLGACQRETPAPSSPAPPATADAARPAPSTALGRTVAKAIDQAKQELRDGNLSLNSDAEFQINGKRFSRRTGDLPPAEITPAGDLIVSGKAVDMDDATRKLALDYREGILAVAETGMDLGIQGADLGMKAAGDAIASIFRGDTDEMEKRIEAEARRLEASALQLCDQLPALLAAQQALAAAVPEFRPYATMDQSDVDDCGEDSDGAAAKADAAAEADAAADRAP